VAARPDRDLELVLAGEGHGGRDLAGRRRASDDRRASIVDRVPEPARLVVRRVTGRDDLGTRPA